MKFLVVCLLLLTCIVALSIRQSEGFFNAPPATPRIPTRIAISMCLVGNIVRLKAKTTDNSTITNVYLVNHSSKNEVGSEEFTNQILVTNATVTPIESSIGNIPLSRMVVGKKYYVIQVTQSTDPNAKKYQGNTLVTLRNTLMGVFTHSQPSVCPVTKDTNAKVVSAASSGSAASDSLQTRTFDRQDLSNAAISGTSKEARNLKQRMNILSDVQSLLKRRILEKRRLPCHDTSCEDDCEEDCEDDTDDKGDKGDKGDKSDKGDKGDSKEKRGSQMPPSAALSQGREYKNATCDHDMTQYIRKDSIPCWKCNLDY